MLDIQQPSPHHKHSYVLRDNIALASAYLMLDNARNYAGFGKNHYDDHLYLPARVHDLTQEVQAGSQYGPVTLHDTVETHILQVEDWVQEGASSHLIPFRLGIPITACARIEYRHKLNSIHNGTQITFTRRTDDAWDVTAKILAGSPFPTLLQRCFAKLEPAL